MVKSGKERGINWWTIFLLQRAAMVSEVNSPGLQMASYLQAEVFLVIHF